MHRGIPREQMASDYVLGAVRKGDAEGMLKASRARLGFGGLTLNPEPGLRP